MQATTQRGQELLQKKSLLAKSSAQAQQCSQGEIAVYLDDMLNFAPGIHGGAYLIKKQAYLHVGLNAFLSEAISRDVAAIHSASGLWVLDGERIGRHIDRLDEYLHVRSNDFIDNPLRSLFYKVMSQPKFWNGPWSVFNRRVTPIGGSGNRKARAFSELIGDLCQMALGANLRRKMEDWACPANSNILRANEYEAYLFRRCPEVSVIELFMWYPQSAIIDEHDASERQIEIECQQTADAASRLGGDGPEPGYDAQRRIPAVPIDVLARDLRHIFDNLGNKTSISRFKIGHACSIEWSRMIGHYARLMFFFDGYRVTDPVGHADLLGDYCTEIAQGRITFLNGNRLPEEYAEAGLILAGDANKRSLLRHRLLLWGQKEQFLRISASQGFKTFRTGDIPAAWRGHA